MPTLRSRSITTQLAIRRANTTSTIRQQASRAGKPTRSRSLNDDIFARSCRPRRPAPRQTTKQLPLDTRRCYDHFARRQVRARVHWYGAQPPPRPDCQCGHLRESVGELGQWIDGVTMRRSRFTQVTGSTPGAAARHRCWTSTAVRGFVMQIQQHARGRSRPTGAGMSASSAATRQVLLRGGASGCCGTSQLYGLQNRSLSPGGITHDTGSTGLAPTRRPA